MGGGDRGGIGVGEVWLGGTSSEQRRLPLPANQGKELGPLLVELLVEGRVESMRASRALAEADATSPLDGLGVIQPTDRTPGEMRSPCLRLRPVDSLLGLEVDSIYPGHDKDNA